MQEIIVKYKTPIKVKCIKSYYESRSYMIGKTYNAIGEMYTGESYLIEIDKRNELHNKEKFEVVNNNE